MSRKLLPSISPLNAATMINLNRMTLLMSISEITPQLFISGQMAATAEQVQRLGITYIVNVAVESAPVVYPKGVKLEKYDIIDFPTAPISNFFHSLTDKIHAHLTANKQHKVLVHCMAGISRSTTIVCAYLMRHMNMSLREAYLLCKKNRPICFPNLGFWSQLITYENQLRKETSVKMISTQFGTVPDVAYEEIKQIRAQQQQQQLGLVSLPALSPQSSSSASSTTTTTPTANNNNNNSANSSTTNNDTVTNQTRPNARDMSINHSSSLSRSRSLNSNNRPVLNTASAFFNNSVYQTSLLSSNKQTFLTPVRFGGSRSLIGNTNLNNASSNNNNNNNNNTTMPPASSTIPSNSYISNRSVPLNVASMTKGRNVANPRNQPTTVTINTTTPTVVNSDDQNSPYETTYRASFYKPLIP